ncbi:MAG: hypothetical protein PVS3B3_37570 [Ktedonobacteraceae bacterium]
MDNPFIGLVALFPFNCAPQGWAACEGQLFSINQNQALFTLLGTNFGGNGTDDFALPDLRGKEPADNLSYYIALQGMYPSRQ